MRIRRRGVSIVDTKKGLLVVSKADRVFMVPGGGADFLESRKRAAIRELYEETGLRAKSARYIADFIGPVHKNEKGITQRNHSKIFLIKASGTLRPSSEVKHVAFWTPKSRLKLMKGTKDIFELYLRKKHH